MATVPVAVQHGLLRDSPGLAVLQDREGSLVDR
jgi:hypothetical protein